MAWGAKELNTAQRELVEEAFNCIERHQRGLPVGLLAKLRSLSATGSIATRKMRARARFLSIPFLLASIELEPSSLGLDVIYDWKVALASCPEDEASRRALIMAKAEQSRLFVAAALVHEGTHALLGLTPHRKDDERAAYRAELQFLSNVLDANPAPLVRNAAVSLIADVRGDALEQEGIEL